MHIESQPGVAFQNLVTSESELITVLSELMSDAKTTNLNRGKKI